MAFDLLHQDGVDLRGLPLTERKRDLTRLCRQSRTPFLKQVETFSSSLHRRRRSGPVMISTRPLIALASSRTTMSMTKR